MLPWDAQRPHFPLSRFKCRDQFLSPRQKQTVKSWKGVLGRSHAGWDEPLRVRYSDGGNRERGRKAANGELRPS